MGEELTPELVPGVIVHEHGDLKAWHAPEPTPDPVAALRLRRHVVTHHAAGSGWAAIAGLDIVREWHNLDHGRDYNGELRPVELVP